MWNKIICLTEAILFQYVQTCLKLFQKLIAAHEYFPTSGQCRWNNFEIISAAEIILFQFQTWLHVKYNNEIILELFQCYISHVTTVIGYMCNNHISQWLHVNKNTEIISKLFQNNFISHVTMA